MAVLLPSRQQVQAKIMKLTTSMSQLMQHFLLVSNLMADLTEQDAKEQVQTHKSR